MRIEPHARGRCHNANYWTQVQILSSDVTGSHAIPMPGEATLCIGTVEHSAYGLALALLSTDGTRLARIVLILQGNTHPEPLCLIGEHVPDGSM